MFGYFRFNQLYAPSRIKTVYRNYYCGTCFALEYNYGELARCILSYDVVILALVARLYDEPIRDRLPCFFQKKEKEQFIHNVGWQKVAAINVLLMSAKFDDDINDEQSKTAKAASVLFGGASHKAEQQFPELARIIKDGYGALYRLESEGADVIDLCNCFADMMGTLVQEGFDPGSHKIDFVKAISRWLYLIDQIDDYDKDVQKGKYNPLVVQGVSKAQYINRDHNCLFSLLQRIFQDYFEIMQQLDRSCYEDWLLYQIMSESIPSITAIVLSGRKLPQYGHCKKQAIWTGDKE